MGVPSNHMSVAPLPLRSRNPNGATNGRPLRVRYLFTALIARVSMLVMPVYVYG